MIHIFKFEDKDKSVKQFLVCSTFGHKEDFEEQLKGMGGLYFYDINRTVDLKTYARVFRTGVRTQIFSLKDIEEADYKYVPLWIHPLEASDPLIGPNESGTFGSGHTLYDLLKDPREQLTDISKFLREFGKARLKLKELNASSL